MKIIFKELKNELKENKKIIFFSIIPIIIVIFVLLFFLINGIYRTDTHILNYIRNFVNDDLTTFMKFITSFCSPVVMITIAIILVIILKRKNITVLIFGNMIFVIILNFILKLIFSRQRPLSYMLIDESGYSFPSGHSMVGIAFYGMIIYITYKLIKKVWLRRIFTISLAVLIALIGFSRIYLGVHYPSDVIAGFAFGYMFLILFLLIARKHHITE